MVVTFHWEQIPLMKESIYWPSAYSPRRELSSLPEAGVCVGGIER